MEEFTTLVKTDKEHEYRIKIYNEQDGRTMVYLSDQQAGDITLPIDVFRTFTKVFGTVF